MNTASFLWNIRRIVGRGPWPAPVALVRAAHLARLGLKPADIGRRLKTTTARVNAVLGASDPVGAALKLPPGEPTAERVKDTERILGQLMVGRCAEIEFENIYKRELNTPDLRLVDLRESRNDTDYRVLNGQMRPVYRINIKFHGSAFRRAAEMVGLDPTDCFALATYKVHASLQKQEQEGLPYFFLVVSALGLSADQVGASIPRDLVETAAVVAAADCGLGKRDFEDAVVQYVMAQALPVVASTMATVAAADWRILSARRANRLLRELLFERVYALRVRNFARAFSGAEVDMHFSLRNDMIDLHRWLQVLRDDGQQRVITLMERGEI